MVQPGRLRLAMGNGLTKNLDAGSLLEGFYYRTARYSNEFIVREPLIRTNFGCFRVRGD